MYVYVCICIFFSCLQDFVEIKLHIRILDYTFFHLLFLLLLLNQIIGQWGDKSKQASCKRKMGTRMDRKRTSESDIHIQR